MHVLGRLASFLCGSARLGTLHTLSALPLCAYGTNIQVHSSDSLDALNTDVSRNMQLIKKLQECHDDHPIAKFWGVCNDVKYELDACFRAEVLQPYSHDYDS